MRLRCLAVVLLASCSVDLEVPDDVIVTCASDADCPEGSQCNPVTKTCAEGQGNLPPGVLVDDVVRDSRAVALAFVVRDGNAAPFGDDRVSLSVEYALDAVTWCPAVSVGDLTGLEASSDGVTHATTLDLLAEVSGGCGLVARQADTDGDELPDLDVVGYASAFSVRATPTDDGSPALGGTAAATSPTGVGNDAPVATLELESRTFRGDLPVAFRVTDSAFDRANVELQFRRSELDPWQDAKLRVGVVDDIESDGRENILVWDSAAPFGLGGIGARSIPDVGLRVRAYDVVGGVQDYGPWSTATLSIDNQTAPVVQGLFAQGGIGSAVSGVVTIEIRVADEESDLVDLLIEYALDDSGTWAPCTEYPDELSDGRYDLQTQAGRGVTHFYRWDSIADLGNATPGLVRLRVQASDGLNTPLLPVLGGVSGLLGLVKGNQAGYSVDFLSVTAGTERIAMGDFNADGRADTVVFTTSQLNLKLGTATGPGSSTLDAYLALTNDRPTGVVAKLNAGPVDDLLVRVDGTTVRPYFGVSAATTAATSLVAGTSVSTDASAMRDLAVGDFDGDGNRDFVIDLNDNTVVMYTGNGVGAFARDLNTYSLPTHVFELAAADFDHDGFDDLVTASESDADELAPIMVWFGQPRVAGGPALGTPVRITTLRYLHKEDELVGNQAAGVALWTGNANGDAFADIGGSSVDLVVNGRPTILLGSAARTFTRIQGPAIEGRVTRVRFGDIDDNGRAELVSATETHVVGVDRLIGDGPTAVMQRLVQFDTGNCLPGQEVGDVTGDGRHEISIARGGCFDLQTIIPTVRPALGPESFGAQSTTEASAGIEDLEVSDLDADGLYDLVCVDRFTDVAFAFEATADVPHTTGGLRLAGARAFDTGISSGLRGPYVTDLDGDGVLDAGVFDGDSQARQVVLRSEQVQGVGTFAFLPAADLGSAALQYSGANRIDAFDLDADGIAELIEAPTSAAVTIHHADVVAGVWQGTYTPETVTTDLGNNNPFVLPADLNNDGVLDLIVAANVGGNASFELLLANASTGAFSNACAGVVSLALNFVWLASADVNDDGLQDLVVMPQGGNTQVSAYTIGTTPCALAFLGSSGSVTGQVPNSFQLADVSQDGVLDIVAIAGVFNLRHVYVATGTTTQGKATGGFSAFADMGANTLGRYVRVADANRDEVPDLYIANDAAATVGVSLGNRLTPFDPWARDLAKTSIIGLAANYGDDRFGVPRVPRLVTRTFVDLEPQVGTAQRDFMSQVRGSRLAGVANPKLRPLSRALQVAGDVGLSAVPDDDTRYRVVHKLGVAGAPGLSLDDAQAPRGVIVTLPVIAANSGVVITGASARPLVVVTRSTDWVRASEWPGDPLYQDPRGDDLLPVARGRPVVRPIHTWELIPADADGDLATGTGPRFIARAGAIDVALDTLGVVQAFYVAP